MKTYTRWLDREFNRRLFKWLEVDTSGNVTSWNISENLQDANDWLIRELFDITEQQLIDMPIKEYKEKLKQVEEAREGKE